MKLLILIGVAGVGFAADCDRVGGTVVAAGAFAPASGPKAAIYKITPEFCRVSGVLTPAADSHIEFEVWMPVKGWNGKYLGVGNGGFAGSIGYPALADAVANGYAASSTDTGHQGNGIDGTWALGHHEKMVDYGHRAIHETAEKAKALVAAYYGDAPKWNYFSSCSNGGRQALMEAQRYPADYDGIIAGAPANDFTHVAFGFVWNQQALDGEGNIPLAKLKAIENAALASCDAEDGVKDGVIDDPTKCHFDPAVLTCKGEASDSCLTEAQVAALKKIYSGPKNSKGTTLFPGFEPGGETGLGGWGAWITGFSPGKSAEMAFANGFFADMTFQDKNWDFRKMNFDGDAKVTDDKMAHLYNATNPDMKAFKAHGGKLLLYHGWSDAALPPTNTIHYYESVVAKMGRREASEFVELYMVPGMQHCGGGPGPNEFGAMSPAAASADHSMMKSIEQWVEKGTAPEKIIATKYKADGNPSSGVARTRPLCPYPMAAKYSGSGSTDEAANFSCAVK
ncbi:MAG TPA: tannase/feruloyl esterase family alpha/beta hydrolase [Bryobacteraceae bacterium]|nr:tannase/feruloyl esterase family alpha/beta hydrolase [Bryobacteraceae bacterium]